MIKYFAVENFRSIKEENIVEFDSGLSKDNFFVANPTIGIAGANASGKSSFVQALNFTIWFMQDSFLSLKQDEKIPVTPFVTCQKKSTKLHLIFSQQILIDNNHKNVDFEYILWVTETEVIKEELLYYPYKRKRIIYQRDKNTVNQGNKITKLESEVWTNLRKNCSVISFAAQFNSQIEARRCQEYQLISNLDVTYNHKNNLELSISEINDIIKLFVKNNKVTKNKILDIGDLGIEDIKVMNAIDILLIPIDEKLTKAIDELPENLTEEVEKIRIEKKDEIKEIINNNNNLDLDKEIMMFKHRIEDSTEYLDLTQESMGTLKFLIILSYVVKAIKEGGLVIIDEIEIKLHQNLVAYIIGLFQNKYENSHGAQLIFSFHNTYFMEILEPNQLWFTQKNDSGYTDIYSAADFKDIKKLQQRSLEELYRLGRFGAKPRGI